jgi:hypothetical protein
MNYGPNVSEKTKESQKMRRALNFILDMDDIDRAKYPQNEEIYNRLKDELETLLINQITNNFPKDEIELFNVLYSLEGFQLKSKDNREEIEKCKKNIIKQFLINNNNFTIDSLKELLIPFDRQSIYSGREKGERSLFIVTFKDYSEADIRYVEILKTIQEVKQELQKAKSID